MFGLGGPPGARHHDIQTPKAVPVIACRRRDELEIGGGRARVQANAEGTGNDFVCNFRGVLLSDNLPIYRHFERLLGAQERNHLAQFLWASDPSVDPINVKVLVTEDSMTKQDNLFDLICTISLHKQTIVKQGMLAWDACDYDEAEPDIVRSFVTERGKGVDYLNEHVARPFNASQSRFVLKFAGVFSHQKPYVTRRAANVAANPGGSSDSCELSDLVFLAVCVDDAKSLLAARASFLQAKKTNKIDNLTQRWLYDYDAEFDYKSHAFWKGTAPKAMDRMLPALDEERSSALQYLLIPPAKKKVTVRQSPWAVDHSHDFSFFLYRLLTFSAGKKYEAEEASDKGWSSIIDDMLRMAAGQIAKTSKMKAKDARRGSADLAAVLDHFNNFRGHGTYCVKGENADVPGVPMVIAIMQDTYEQDDNVAP